MVCRHGTDHGPSLILPCPDRVHPERSDAAAAVFGPGRDPKVAAGVWTS